MADIEPVTAEIIKHSLIYAAEEMGVALKKSAYSPNIRERADHSCALLDGRGRTVAQAEHIPVHLGSLPWGLRNTLAHLDREGIALEEGDMILLNNPYIAGTHLNDVTVIRPVFLDGKPEAYAANKAHHADVGGAVPGSIGAASEEIFQEGIILPPVKILRRDEFQVDLVRALTSNVRMPEVTMGDLRAQIAANLLGERRIREVVDRYGAAAVRASWDRILDQTERTVRMEYGKMPRGRYEAEDHLESASPRRQGRIRIHTAINVNEDGIRVDFAGTDSQVEGPVNSVFGVAIAATLFAVRSLLRADIPLNDGFHRTVEISAPEGTIVNPQWPAAVAAGNVETPQRIVDVIYRAFAPALPDRVPAASHGSMTNVMLGGIHPTTRRPWAFYETIGGGYGGRKGLDGVDGVHVNMTNTLNTPIEVIERYYPLRFVAYRLRPDSGGTGRWRGGCGIERAWIATAPMRFTIVGERSEIPPWGLFGGGPGGPSRYAVVRADGTEERLGSKAEVSLRPGDRVVVLTGGGGGYGESKDRDPKQASADADAGLVSPKVPGA
ncbi:MAG TPA: hydantoinase B/oxoprolinase family protein [Thermoplasmata archaeon]|nr:hydantoinase B/oxoprolinase family protein [Thermoplasmata archaeon]